MGTVPHSCRCLIYIEEKNFRIKFHKLISFFQGVNDRVNALHSGSFAIHTTEKETFDNDIWKPDVGSGKRRLALFGLLRNPRHPVPGEQN